MNVTKIKNNVKSSTSSFGTKFKAAVTSPKAREVGQIALGASIIGGLSIGAWELAKKVL